MAKLLGIDPGKRWVGLAGTDETETIATPLETIDRKNVDFAERLNDLIREQSFDRIIVGFPEPLKVSSNERTREVESFIEEYIAPLGVDYETVSERYTTKEAKRLRSERDQTPEEASDAEAAALILQHYIDSQSTTEQHNGDEA